MRQAMAPTGSVFLGVTNMREFSHRVNNIVFFENVVTQGQNFAWG